MTPRATRRRLFRRAAPLLAVLSALSASKAALAQNSTFYLDRLQVAGAPDDGVGVWRPQMGQKTRFYGQLGLGYSLNPFRVENYVDTLDQAPIVQNAQKNGNPITMQLTTYLNAGVEILDRFAFQVSFPLAVYQAGGSLNNSEAEIQTGVNVTQTVVPMDLRFDGRVIIFRNESRSFKLGGIATLWAPTGNEYSFGGDTSVTGALGLAAEYDARFMAVTLNAGYHFRPNAQINEFHLADELTFGAGVFVPLLDERLRLGAEFLGSVGIRDNTTGDVDNTPLEWRVEGRGALGEDRNLWVGLSAGTRASAGYAPDLRVVAAFGGWFNLFNTKAKSPDFVYVIPGDADKDKLPDDIDMCPNDKEDGKGPNADDGCPELLNDSDSDGIPDAQDACPHEPGVKDPDPKKNGCPEFIRRKKDSDQIEVLKEVQFAFDRADLLTTAFPILNEVVRLLNVNPEIELVRIEGHTDDYGSHKYNDELSQDRADSVMRYLVQRGIAADRLEAKGFGKRRPLVENDTPEGRAKNRRVEFHIVRSKGQPPVQSTGGGAAPPGSGAPAAPPPSAPTPPK